MRLPSDKYGSDQVTSKVDFRPLIVGERNSRLIAAENEQEMFDARAYTFNQVELQEVTHGLMELAQSISTNPSEIHTLRALIDYQFTGYTRAYYRWKNVTYLLFFIVPLCAQLSI